MGCGLNRVLEKNRATGQEIKKVDLCFRISDLKKMKNMKKRGLFIINESNFSQECSSIKGMSGSYGNLTQNVRLE